LSKVLGENLDAVVLDGSQAQGDAEAGSDIDVLCLMKGPFDDGDLIEKTSAVTAALSLKHDVVLSRTFVSLQDYESRRTPFLMNVRREQVAL